MRTLTKRPHIVSILLIVTLALATLVASGASPATSQVVSRPQPTVTPTVVPPTKNEDALSSGDATQHLPDEILDLTWYWERYADMAGLNDITVAAAKYTLTLLADGTFRLLVDCNRASGTYAVSESQITLHVGPMTRAFCGEDSLHDQYLRLLGDVVTFVMDGDKLVLNLKMDAGNLVFGREVPSPLAGTTWHWTTASDGSDVADPDKYTLTFTEDGPVAIKADCNRASGGYALAGGSLIIQIGPMTLAECEPGSLYNDFVRQLGMVKGYSLEGDGTLTLTLADGASIQMAQAPAN